MSIKIEVSAAEWTEALKAVSPHRAPATAVEVSSLQGVRVEVNETGAYLVATDRYTLIMRRLDGAHFEGVGAATLGTANVKRIVSAASGWLRITVPLTLTVEDDRVTFITPESSLTFRALDGQFPKYEQLIYTAIGQLDGTDRGSDFGCSPHLLAKWAKACAKHDPIQVRLTRNGKTAVIVGPSFIGLQMPHRVSSFSVPAWAPQPTVKSEPVEAVA